MELPAELEFERPSNEEKYVRAVSGYMKRLRDLCEAIRDLVATLDPDLDYRIGRSIPQGDACREHILCSRVKPRATANDFAHLNARRADTGARLSIKIRDSGLTVLVSRLQLLLGVDQRSFELTGQKEEERCETGERETN